MFEYEEVFVLDLLEYVKVPALVLLEYKKVSALVLLEYIKLSTLVVFVCGDTELFVNVVEGNVDDVVTTEVDGVVNVLLSNATCDDDLDKNVL